VNIIKLDVELQGNRDVTVNGVNALAEKSRAAFDEKIFKKQLTTNQQHVVACEVCRLAARVWAAYQDMRVARGEITEVERGRMTLTL